jgi:hypothetical protein
MNHVAVAASLYGDMYDHAIHAASPA